MLLADSNNSCHSRRGKHLGFSLWTWGDTLVASVYLGTLWWWECRVPDLPGPSGLTWKCRLTWCSVQIQILVSAFSNLAKCLQKIINIFMSCLPMCLFVWFSTYNSVRGHWRTAGQKKYLKNYFFCLPEAVFSIWKRNFCSLAPLSSETLL